MDSANHIIKDFFEENPDYVEIKTGNQSTIREFVDIDEYEDEVWIVQCPKGNKLSEVSGQKLKLPGRSHFGKLEAVAVEFPAAEKQAFGYCNSKGKYTMRMLPIHGSILIRKRLKVNEMSTKEKIEDLCPAMGKVPLPENIKMRHPLLGAHFEERLQLNKAIVQDLRAADKISSAVARETRMKKCRSTKKPTIEIKRDDDLVVISKAGNKKLKRKSNVTEMVQDEDISITSTKKAKRLKRRLSNENVVEDLSWLNLL